MLEKLEKQLENMVKVQRHIALQTLTCAMEESDYCLHDTFGDAYFYCRGRENAKMLKLALGDEYGPLEVAKYELVQTIPRPVA